ncbi:hypothetical protein PMIN01_10329 [Paraphaeosphaeria minitans]|uniref:Uncharacterized protein n=1 Tax=Paraphaeosphaeria minitans TaxID=565426 RepID=A0A9P6G8Z1_9PLEO|nr:hypothetical protein PMIN01_10329 [Paraphaeosphaeria minitans]
MRSHNFFQKLAGKLRSATYLRVRSEIVPKRAFAPALGHAKGNLAWAWGVGVGNPFSPSLPVHARPVAAHLR